ncbi:PaaI family thioesterase [Caldithrix abyssi]
MNINTHHKIDRNLCGTPVELIEGAARVSLTASESMAADELGLVHGGFIFGLADYAAMLAVNHPNVVLAWANVDFLKPVKVGDQLIAEARITEQEKNKALVEVIVKKSKDMVFSGKFFCVITRHHVLEG